MAVDAVLWLILAGMIAFIACGCVLTARGGRRRSVGEGAFERKFDRAA